MAMSHALAMPFSCRVAASPSVQRRVLQRYRSMCFSLDRVAFVSRCWFHPRTDFYIGSSSILLYCCGVTAVCRASRLKYNVLTAIVLLHCALIVAPQVWYSALTRSIALCGTAFIKWGQWSSTRPDMFPEGLCNSLAVLHKGAPSHKYAYTKVSVVSPLAKTTSSIQRCKHV